KNVSLVRYVGKVRNCGCDFWNLYYKFISSFLYSEFTSNKALVFHMKSRTHASGRVPCDLCNETFLCLNRLESHIRLTHQNKGVKFPNCKKTLPHQKSLHSHLKHFCPNVIREEIKCGICMKGVRGKMNLYDHMRHWHKKGK